MRTIDEDMKFPYKMEIVSNTEEGEYVVSFPDLPGCLAVGDTISARSLEEMGRAISNYMKGEVAPAIDLSDF